MSIDSEQLRKWRALPLVKWDYETPLCLFQDDTFFFDIYEVRDYAEEHDMKVGELQLVLCTPIYAHELDPDDWIDDLPDDGDAPGWLQEAIRTFNAVLHAQRDKPLSWTPGHKRVVLADKVAA